MITRYNEMTIGYKTPAVKENIEIIKLARASSKLVKEIFKTAEMFDIDPKTLCRFVTRTIKSECESK